MINEPDNESGSADYWVEEIRHLASSFDTISFVFCPCVCNSLADKVAKNARLLGLNVVWYSDYPTWILNQLLNDVCISHAHVAS